MNPYICYKIYDAFTFILLLSHTDWLALREKNHPLSLLYDYNDVKGEPKKNETELYRENLIKLASNLIGNED